ncbi:heme-degrading monooxygenase HmoA [Paenarthrobacter nicotinovorans]|uniref:antibiotic biosynthesis monooxygenase family protein n=1 Tax=Micrococcaceae TaxID=1268 RepID=UPI0008769F6D|nr:MULTISPECIES: antibiotic biosynthesis monooxygenase family protein [Micrococcaceae]MDR6436596.1 heme-degrading monooxygenase HmoA [Paenarthrobacter nicotinovorans]SCZ57198.1 Antibiotic biosynthesis monooxygenase [Arthrobacter sp. UNCCL28]
MIYEHAELRINPETEEEFLAEFTAATHLLLAAQGCHSVELQASVDTAGIYLLRVGWESLEDHTVVFPGTSQAEVLYKILLAHCLEAPHVVHFSGQDVLNTR